MKKIFISSTYDDLRQHRIEVTKSLHALGQIVNAMEYWGSGPQEPLEKCLEKVRKSDILVCVIGCRYGSASSHGKSFTQLEYETTLKCNLDIFTYIIDEKKHPIFLENIEFGDAALKLKEFKILVSEKIRSKFSSPEDLARKVVTDIVCYLDDVGGNVRAALESHGLSSINALIGYSYGETGSVVDLSQMLIREGRGYKFSSELVSSIVSAAYILENISKGDYSFLEYVVSFQKDVYEILHLFLKRMPFDKQKLSNEILHCRNSNKLRLLIVLAKISRADECVESICIQTIDGNTHRSNMQQVGMQTTPFYTVVRNSLKEMGVNSLAVLEHYAEVAAKMNRWQAKKEFDKAIKEIKNRIK
ncbi:MAG: DUF4062 domain-containing protein [Solidesulfovibrio sp. DCME]|uniref:DUF4062 domain-containing protein n=1 Tax=Solidesulfovibrio sp. DCME TaxID=3447380 RepID=UPI003D0B2CD8